MGDNGENSEETPSPGTPETAEDESSHEEPTAADAAELDSLGDREGWQIEGEAARVHYSGASDRYSIEYYAPSECVLYWKVPPADAGETAVPVGRDTVPDPLRTRIREDLAAAGIDPDVENRSL